jgi:hypothetical protein
VYWGDSSGRIFDMNGTGSGGDGGTENVQLYRKHRQVDTSIIEVWPWRSRTPKGRVFYRRVGESQITVSLDWSDEYNVSDNTVTLKGPPAGDTGAYFGGSAYFGGAHFFRQGFAFASKESSRGFTPVGKGLGFFPSVSAQSKVRFEVDRIELT